MLVARTITNAGAPLHSPDGDLLVGVQIHFRLVDVGGQPSDAWDAVTLERVGGEAVVATTDAAGEFSVDLWPNTRGNRATKYKCRVQFDGFREFSGTVEDVPGELQWVDFMLSGSAMEPQDISAIATAIASHVASADPHTQYAKEADLGGAAGLDVGNTAGTVAAGNDPRLSDSRTPTGGAGGVLSGSYPNPGFAVDMATQAELDAVASTRIPTTARGAAGGVASLDDTGKVPESQLPAIAITDTFAVASQGAMLALTAERGDIAVRTDLNKSFVLAAEPATTLGNWVELRTPTDAVLSVAGKTGAVTLGKADVGLGSVDDTSDASKPVSTAQAAAIATATAIHPFLLIGA